MVDVEGIFLIVGESRGQDHCLIVEKHFFSECCDPLKRFSSKCSGSVFLKVFKES